jgi:hypothetical protein
MPQHPYPQPVHQTEVRQNPPRHIYPPEDQANNSYPKRPVRPNGPVRNNRPVQQNRNVRPNGPRPANDNPNPRP